MKKIILLASVLLLTTQAQAAIISGGTILPSMTVINEDNPTNTAQQGMNEKQGVNIGKIGIEVDGTQDMNGMPVGTKFVGANQKVDSHLIFLNTKGNREAFTDQTWIFSGDILGVMSSNDGDLMSASQSLLAYGDYFTAQGNTGNFNNLGLEQYNYGVKDGYMFSGNMLNLSMFVTEPGDWIRVVTVSQVPVPAALFLFAPALLGFLGLRRKNKAA